ncbi:PIPO, partial [Ugandan cassava brown streak virus]|uniref:PIPO n=1 Tax=Ugandan cassava brown streak virus TaxID=946046 RepID=UPI000265501B
NTVRSTRNYVSRAHQTSVRRVIFLARTLVFEARYRLIKSLYVLGGTRGETIREIECNLLHHFQTGNRDVDQLDLRSV